MPLYPFTNEDETEIIDVFFHMNDEKVFIGPDGKQWRRVYTVPQMSIDTQIDAYSKDQFIRRTEKYSTVGDHMDKSKELSALRVEKNGYDPIKQKYFDNYSKARSGKPHPASLPRKFETNGVVVDYS